MADKFVVYCYGLVFDNGRILLVKPDEGPWYYRWTLPGGGLIAGESFQHCIERTIEEETSCSVKAVRQVTTVLSSKGGSLVNRHAVMVFYLCQYRYGDPQARKGINTAIWADEELFTSLAEDLKIPYQFIEAVSELCIIPCSFPDLSFDFSRAESILRGMIID